MIADWACRIFENGGSDTYCGCRMLHVCVTLACNFHVTRALAVWAATLEVSGINHVQGVYPEDR
jgi:hypothetical protein